MNIDNLLFERVLVFKYKSKNSFGVCVMKYNYYFKIEKKFKRAFKDCILTPEKVKELDLWNWKIILNGNTRKNLKEEKRKMAIPKGKERITITIHKETKQLLDNLLALHSEHLTYSNLVEIAIVFYAKACNNEIEKLEAETEKGDLN